MIEPASFALADGTMVQPCVPFFIAGSGRCGTTLMRRLLIQRTGAVIPPENYLLAVSPRLLLMAHGDWTAFCRLVLANLVKHSGRWEDFGIDAAAALGLFAALPSDCRSVANFWHAFHALYARHVGRPGATRWGDKTPSSVDALPEIAGIFPDARFIFMVRDVFDMAWSFGSMATAGRAGDYIAGARRWADANAKLAAFQPQHATQCITVRYEDLVHNPEAEMQRVLRHLDVKPRASGTLSAAETGDMAAQPDLQAAIQDVHVGSVGKGRVNLPDDIRAAIAAIAGPMLIRLGYRL